MPLRLIATCAVSLLVADGCRSRDAEAEALAQLYHARHQLAALASDARSGFARDATDLARESLLSAESAVRRGRRKLWEPKLQRALDTVTIATWVVERQRQSERGEAEAWLESANESLEGLRSSLDRHAHRASRSQLRRAQTALGAARELFRVGEFRSAAEGARRAIELAADLPDEVRALHARFDDPHNQRRWNDWAHQAVREASRTKRAAFIVDKRAQTAMLWEKGKPTRWFAVDLGYEGLTRKLAAGDGATPEGLYRVVRKKSRGETKYYKALLLNYPNDEDRRRFSMARAEGRLGADASIGGLIEIHGDGGRGSNWTDGCIALENGDMDVVFAKLSVGSPVAIVGTHGGLHRKSTTE